LTQSLPQAAVVAAEVVLLTTLSLAVLVAVLTHLTQAATLQVAQLLHLVKAMQVVVHLVDYQAVLVVVGLAQ
jgi:hypothetical protein